MSVLDVGIMVFVGALIIYILFFVGIIVKVKQGEKKEKELKELEENLEKKQPEKEKVSAKQGD